MDGGVTDDSLAEQLIAICGDENVVRERHALRTYESDGLLQYAAIPKVAVLPGSGDEVAAVVGVCHRAGVPWVARGSGSGLSGGAVPIEEGVLIVLTRMRRILEVDLDNQRVVCEPGVTNIAISEAVGPSHFYPPDPSSQIVCSIGGNVAENSGGAHCFKYGFTTNYVCGLKVVLPDGSLVELGGKELDVPGYDLLGVFVGSEGTLGIATEITVRVMPSPESVRTLVAFFDSPQRRRARRLGHRRRRRRAGRDRDDGQPHDPRLGGDGGRRLADRRRRGAARRARRPRAEMRGALRPAHRDLPRTGLGGRARRARRGRARRCSGRCASRRSPRWGVCRRTTTCRTRSSRARKLTEVLDRIAELSSEYDLHGGQRLPRR